MFSKKFDSEKLIFKVFSTSVIIFLLSVMFIFFKNESDIERILEKNENDLMLVSEGLVEGIYNYYYGILETGMDQIVRNDQIVKAFADRDREQLKKLVLPNFNVLAELGIGQYHFHLPDNTSFFRVHYPNYYGDDLSGFRKMVVDANSKQETIKGIEEGIAGLGIRHVTPIFFEGGHIGTVELGISLNGNLLKLLRNATCCEWDLLSIDNSELSAQLPESILNKIKNNESGYIREKEYSQLYIPLVDYSNNVTWYLVRYHNKKEENALLRRQKKTNYMFAFLVVLSGAATMAFVLEHILKELSYLAKEAKILEGGDFTQTIRARGGTEIKELAYALESMRKSILKSNRELEISREKFKALSDCASDWIVWRDPQGGIIYTSPSCEQITGHTAEQFKRCPQLYFRIVHPDYRAEMLEHMHMERLGGDYNSLEFQIITKSGTTRWISHVCGPIYDPDGNFAGIRSRNTDITDYKKLMEKLERNNKKLKELSIELLNVQEMERKYLARELHDELGQIFTAIKLNLQMLNEDIVEIDSNLNGRLDESISLVDFATKQIRQQALDLRPPDFDDAKIMEIMQNMYENFVKDTGIKTDLIVKGDVVDIDRELGLVIYRCVQESLTNIVRHADADSVTITFDWQKDRLLLTVKDEGCGFSMDEKNNPNDHIGLIGMRERMELVNGKMKIISDVNKGTKIEFTIPFDERGR